jgi:hypothetical protein
MRVIAAAMFAALWLVIFCCSVEAAHAQRRDTIFGHTYVGSYPNGAETLVSVDPASGSVKTLGGVPNSGSLGVLGGIAALDNVTHRYFFVGVLPPYSSETLYVMNIDTGAEVAAVPLSMPVNLAGMQFDPWSGYLFGHTYLGSIPNGAETLVSIDPVSGNVKTVGSVPNSGSLEVFGGVAALDSANRRYFFPGSIPSSANKTYEMNIDTGAEVAELPLPVNLSAMEFDPLSGYLFGHTYLGSFPNGAETLVSIDPASGNVKTVGSVPNSGSLEVFEGVAALDSINRRYFFPGLILSSENKTLYEMNIDTGAEVAEFPLSVNLMAIELPQFQLGRFW